MKRAMQAILIAGEEMMTDVILYNKLITIREGHRDYTPGPVLIGCGELNWARIRTITDVKHTTLGEVSKEDLMADGFLTHKMALRELKHFYPNITLDSDVTVVRWE